MIVDPELTKLAQLVWPACLVGMDGTYERGNTILYGSPILTYRLYREGKDIVVLGDDYYTAIQALRNLVAEDMAS